MEQKKAEALLLRAQAAARGVPDSSLQASIECGLAEHFGDADAFDRATQLFDTAVDRLRAAPERDLATLASCLTSRSMIDMLRGDSDAALADAQAALASFGSPRQGQRSLAVTAHSALADALSMRGELALAVTEYERAIDELTRWEESACRWPDHAQRVGFATLESGTNAAGCRGIRARSRDRTRDRKRGQRRTYSGDQLRQGAGRPRPRARGDAAIRGLPCFCRAARSERSIALVSLLSAPAWCAEKDFARCEALLARARTQMQARLPAGHSSLGTLEMEEAELAIGRQQNRAARRSSAARVVDLRCCAGMEPEPRAKSGASRPR